MPRPDRLWNGGGIMSNIIDSQAMGADFCWSFGDGDARACMLPREAVRAVFVENGFDPALIEDVDASEAIRRAAGVASKSKRIKIIQMDRPNRDTPRAFGIYQVTPIEGESGDSIICGARVRVTSGTSAVCLPPMYGSEIEACMVVGREMVNIVSELCENVYNRDVSQALVAAGNQMGWLGRRRNKGGCYYLNRPSAERFAQLLKAIERMTSAHPRAHQFIPHITEQYDRPLTVASWSGAAQDHYASKVQGLVGDLDKLFVDGKMRDSTIIKNRDACDKLLTEAISYRQFMKGQLNPLEDRLKAIRGAFNKALIEGNSAIESDLREIEKLVGIGTPKKVEPVAAPPEEVTQVAPTNLTAGDFDVFG